MDNNNAAELNEFKELVKNFDTIMMTTLGRDGHLHSRPMATQKPQPDSLLWFVSSVDTAKAQDLEKDPRVNLGYLRASDNAWISVAGKARLEQNPAKIKALWQEDWKIWFPGGAEQPDLAIIHVEPQEVTYWKPEMGKIGTLFKMAKAYVKGEQPDMKPPTTVSV